MNSSHKVNIIILKFGDDYVKVLEGRDLDLGAVMTGCCTTTTLLLILQLLFATLIQKMV